MPDPGSNLYPEQRWVPFKVTTENQILDGLMVLLSRVRNKTVSLDGVERGLEVISHNLRTLRDQRNSGGCCGSVRPTPDPMLKASALRQDIDRRTIG